jgi:hypothetical protein
MNYTTDDFDDDDYRKAADEALTRPSDASFWDDRLYTTHGGPIVSWAPDSDDLISESNYHTVLEHLQSIAAEAGEDDAVIDGTVKHWTYSYFRVIYVQVYDGEGNFTRTFKEAYCVARFLRDEGPIFDETDFNDREWQQNERLFDETLSEVADRHEYDEPFDRDSITEALHEARYDGKILDNYPDVTFDEVAEAWDGVREAYFTKRALEEGFAPLDGQLSII